MGNVSKLSLQTPFLMVKIEGALDTDDDKNNFCSLYEFQTWWFIFTSTEILQPVKFFNETWQLKKLKM